MHQIIINPIAGKGSSLKALEIAEDFFRKNDMPYRVHKTEYPKHATELAERLSKEGGSIIAMGGDGTFNEVLNGIVDFENVTVGFLPCGTGNDYVRSLDIPTDTEEFLKLVKEGKTGYTDFIEVNGSRRALNCVGTGVDVDVLENYAKLHWPNGKMKYQLALLKTIFNLKFHKLKLTLDGKETEKSLMIIGAANGKYIGGGMPVSPFSVADDGLLDFVFYNEVKKSKIIPYLLKFMKGKQFEIDGWAEHYLVEEATIEVLDGGNVQMDGEIMPMKVMRCKCIHNVLKIYRN